MPKDNETANLNTDNSNNNQPSVFQKGMTIDKLKEKFEKKIDTAKAKEFEQKFEAKYKELDKAESVVRLINKELEKLWIEFNEGI